MTGLLSQWTPFSGTLLPGMTLWTATTPRPAGDVPGRVSPAGFTPGTRQIGLSYLFSSSAKYTDTETGLLYYGYRYYLPSMGRWLSRDPIEEKGGMNLYAYVRGNPIRNVNSYGLTITQGDPCC